MNNLKGLDSTIKKILASGVAKENQALVKYQIDSGGKRIRPNLAIICCRLFGGKLPNVLHAAAGLEIIHNYSLIIDDIIDHGVLRRKKKTTWANYGKSIAECIGVDYAASIMQAANRSKNPAKISALFSETLKKLVDGEILDILFEQAGRDDEPFVKGNRYKKITEKHYLKMASGKTAALMAAACQAGAISAGASDKNTRILIDYGFNLGLAFQVRDDILDIFGNEKAFEKEIGKDIKERKLGNLVILSALKEFNKKYRQKFLKIIRKKEIKKNDIKEGIGLLSKTRSRQKTEVLAKKFIEEAKKNLKYLPQNRWNNALRQIADFVVEREK